MNTYLCGCKETPESLGGRLPRWAKNELTYALEHGSLGDLDRPEILSSLEEATDRWSDVCNLKFSHWDSIQADILVFLGHPQGSPGGVLADMEMPDGSNRQLKMRVDDQEDFSIFDSGTSHFIDLTRVLCHEIGHAIGIPHLAGGNLMQPSYANITHPQQRDIAEAQLRYPGSSQPDPPPTEEPIPQQRIIIGDRQLLFKEDGSLGWKLYP